jgi:hypothetical protein
MDMWSLPERTSRVGYTSIIRLGQAMPDDKGAKTEIENFG